MSPKLVLPHQIYMSDFDITSKYKNTPNCQKSQNVTFFIREFDSDFKKVNLIINTRDYILNKTITYKKKENKIKVYL